MSYEEVCSVKQGCKYEVTYACTCGDPVVLICQDCINAHLSESSAHLLISLDQARTLLRNRLSPEDFNRNMSRYVFLKLKTQKYIKNLKRFRGEIESFQNQILSLIQEKCQASVEYLLLLEEKAKSQLKSLKTRMKTFTSAEDRLLNKFETEGLRGVIEDYQEKLELRSSPVLSAIDEMISLIHLPSNSQIKPFDPSSDLWTSYSSESKLMEDISSLPSSSHSSIYIPKRNSKKLLRFDVSSNQLSEYNLSSIVSQNFEYTSTCILSSSSVIIAGGGWSQAYGDTYRLNPTNGHCIKLNNLNFPRHSVHLFCYNKHVYAFGGFNNSQAYSQKAERMEIQGTGWQTLPDMKQPRCCFGSYLVDSRLYLFGGDNAGSVEFYDFIDNSFNLCFYLTAPKGGCLAGAVGDRVYILGKSLMVRDSRMKVVKEIEGACCNFTNLSDVVVVAGKIVFYSSPSLYAFDTENFASKEIRAIN
jgi:hypothetical protein